MVIASTTKTNRTVLATALDEGRLHERGFLISGGLPVLLSLKEWLQAVGVREAA
jgi:hypothetical protein